MNDDVTSDDAALLATLHNYELFLRLAQRTQQIARLLLDRPVLVTRAHVESWEADAISVQPEIDGWISALRQTIAARHTARAATDTDGEARQVM